MINFFLNKRLHAILLLTVAYVVLLGALYKLTVEEGEKYYNLSLSNRIKKIETISYRGEIYDRNGVPLAVNNLGYSVELNSALIPTKQFSEVTVAIYDFFAGRGEEQLEFPIRIEGESFYYVYDRELEEWLTENGYSVDVSARSVFEDAKLNSFISKDLSDYESYKLLYDRGVILPISSGKMDFLPLIRKNEFLKSYGIEAGTSPEEAFRKIRKRRDFYISDDLSDEDAYKVMVYRHKIRTQGYLKYEPIIVAPNVSKETAILVSENGVNFPGLQVQYSLTRYYPHHEQAAHIVGYLGKIATESEKETFVDQKGYHPDALVGKTGLESSMEDVLRSVNGYKHVEVDVFGKYVADLEDGIGDFTSKPAVAGKHIKTTIDIAFTKTVYGILERMIESLHSGSVFTSELGDMQVKKYPNAKIATAAVVDIKTGEVLSAVSYPSYDANVFTGGISSNEWNALAPKNPRDPLSPRPLYNSVSMMAVQPGSTYKMITGYAAMTQGMKPNAPLFADGKIEFNNKTFGCWIWNQYRGRHGNIDFYHAIEQSCNYYFYDIATGKDYYRDRNLNFEMNHKILIEQSKKFGLHEKTGVEIEESIIGVPDPDKKIDKIKAILRINLSNILPDYFEESVIGDNVAKSDLIETILSWAEENPSRNELIKRFRKLGANDPVKIAEIVKYDYFNQINWYESDTLNLAIGQGDHAYTTLQMARYAAIVGNGGVPIQLTLLKEVDGNRVVKNQNLESFDKEGLLPHLQKAMYMVLNGKTIIADIFRPLPVKIAAKTGTAQKEGQIPPEDEVEYFRNYLKRIDPQLSFSQVEERTISIIHARSDEMAMTEKAIASETDEQKLALLTQRFDLMKHSSYLSKASAMRQAIKELSSKKITDDDLNQFRSNYDNFAWFIAYGPYEDPEIAVAVSIPQGGTANNAGIVVREIFHEYLKSRDRIYSSDRERKDR